jgi:hypothetical protein
MDYLNSSQAPCIALEFDEGRYFCGLVKNPAKYLIPQKSDDDHVADEARRLLSPGFAAILYLGAGCDSD